MQTAQDKSIQQMKHQTKHRHKNRRMWTLTDKNTDLETYLKRQRQNVMLTNFLKIPIETDMNSKRLKETVKKIPIETDMNSKRLKETE